MKGIYPRGSTFTYVIDLPPDPLTGERRQKSKGGFITPEEAKIARDEMKLEVQKGIYRPDPKMTVEEYMLFWLENFSKVKHRKTTYITNRDIIFQKIIPKIGNVKLSKLTADKVEKFIASLQKEKKNGKKLSDAYIHGIFRVLRRALRQAHFKWKLLRENIMAEVEAPPAGEKKERLTWTLEQCQIFLEEAKDSPYHEAYIIAINTGFRRGECIGFREVDLHSTEKYLEVTQTLTYHKDFGFIIQPPKTAKSKRKIPILDEYLYEQLAKKIKINEENKTELGDEYQDQWGLLVCHRDGSPVRPSQLRYDYEKLIKRTGLPYIRFHDIRHSFATNIWELGFDIKDVQELLGHSTIAVTGDIYTHMRENKKKVVMAGFSEAMRRAKNG